MSHSLSKIIARNFLFPFVVKIGLQKFIISKHNGILNIYFHGVSPTDFTKVSGRHMQLKQFENLINYLSKNFHIIDLDASFEMQKPSNAQKQFISISFDDGYYNNYKYLPEILISKRIPVTIFTCGVALARENYVMWTDQIALLRYFMQGDYIEIRSQKYFKVGIYDLCDQNGMSLYKHIKQMGPEIREQFLLELDEKYNTINKALDFDIDYWKLMNADQLVSLQNTGNINIASHGMYHYNLANITPEQAKNDMLAATQMLNKVSAKSIDSISFPDGSYNQDVIHQAHEVGHHKLWISDYNVLDDRSNLLLRTRFGVSSTTNYYSNILSIHKAFAKYGI